MQKIKVIKHEKVWMKYMLTVREKNLKSSQFDFTIILVLTEVKCSKRNVGSRSHKVIEKLLASAC